MELKQPIRKRNSHHINVKPPFPVITSIKSGIIDDTVCAVYTGHYNGNCVIIDDPEEMIYLNTTGFFGKGSLSRCYPKLCKSRDGIPPIIKERQWTTRSKWMETVYSIENSANRIAHLTVKDGESNGEEIHSNPKNKKNITPNIEDESGNGKTINLINIQNNISEGSGGMSESNSNKNYFKMEGNERVITLSRKRSIDSINDIEKSENKRHCNTKKVEQSTEITLGKESNERTSEVLVLADTDSETEDNCDNVKLRIENEKIKTVFEELHLTLEEAFFLSFALGCLEVIDLAGNQLSIKSMWALYREAQKNFIEKYVAYHHFRSKGWIVKTGLKFGGDFILYKKGPSFYHASYIVIIEVIDLQFKRSVENCKRTFTWSYLGGLNRLAESTHKEVIICQIQWPEVSDEEMKTPYVLKKFKVNEVLLRRWQAKQEREFNEKN